MIRIKQIRANNNGEIIYSGINGNLTSSSTLKYDGSKFDYNKLPEDFTDNSDIPNKLYVDTAISNIVGGLNYKGTWNADTNTPTLTSGIGTAGDYYIIGTAGTTNIDGITDWQIGDWIIFNTNSPASWQKIDNTDSVLSVNSKIGNVVLNMQDITAIPISTGFLKYDGVNFLYDTNTYLTSSDITGKEDLSNKTNSITESPASLISYPTENAVINFVNAKINDLSSSIIGTSASNGLTLTVGSPNNIIELGGSLTKNTTIDGGSPGNNLSILNLNNFNITSSSLLIQDIGGIFNFENTTDFSNPLILKYNTKIRLSGIGFYNESEVRPNETRTDIIYGNSSTRTGLSFQEIINTSTPSSNRSLFGIGKNLAKYDFYANAGELYTTYDFIKQYASYGVPDMGILVDKNGAQLNKGPGIFIYKSIPKFYIPQAQSAFTDDQQLVNKLYVDLKAVSGSAPPIPTFKGQVKLVSITDINLTGSTPLIIDGVTTVNTDIILLAAQENASPSSPFQNGVYRVNISGGTYNLTRHIDYDNSPSDNELVVGTYVEITHGSHAGQYWSLALASAKPIVVDGSPPTDMYWTEFNPAATALSMDLQENYIYVGDSSDFATPTQLTLNSTPGTFNFAAGQLTLPYNANNGLTYTNGLISLGGSLISNTTITGGSPSYSLSFTDLNSFSLSTSGNISFTGNQFSISSLVGTGDRMVVTNSLGVLSFQDIPSSASLSATHIGYGSLSNILTGTNDFVYNTNGKVIINKPGITFVSPFSSSTSGILSGGNSAWETISIQNIGTTGFTGFTSGQSNSNFMHIGQFGTAYVGNYNGTSIEIKNTTHFRSSNYTTPIVIGGTPIYNLIGTTSTNYGTRLDATGLRIGLLSTMHNSNSYAFETSGNIRFSNLAGNGPGFVAVNNSGELSFTDNNAVEISDAYNLFNYYNFK